MLTLPNAEAIVTLSTLIASLLVAFGVGPSMADSVRAVIVAAGPILTTVWVHEKAATTRHATAMAAQVGMSQAAAAADGAAVGQVLAAHLAAQHDASAVVVPLPVPVPAAQGPPVA